MTDQQHPITPPPELVKKWVSLACEYEGDETWTDLATQAAEWGADQELEACCKYLSHKVTTFSADAHLEAQRRSDELRAARRPKPPSLKEQALAELEVLSDYAHGLGCSESAIRRAIESLPS